MHAIAVTFWVLWVLFVVSRLVTAYYGHEPAMDSLSPNLLGNPEFDSPIATSSSGYEWYVSGSASVTYEALTTGCYSGDNCMHVTDRTESWRGLKCRIRPSDLGANGKFWVSMFIKFTEDNNTAFNVPFILKTAYISPQSADLSADYTPIMRMLGVRADNRWLYMGVELFTGDDIANIDHFEIYPDAPAGIAYALDATSLRKIHYSNWSADALTNMQTHRQGVVNVRTIIPPCYNSGNIRIEFEQTAGLFGFGTSVNADILINAAEETLPGYNARYVKYFQDNFNWLQFTHHTKWRTVEGNTKGEYNVDGSDMALAWLKAYKKGVRGHFLHSNNVADQPGWVKNIADTAEFTAELEGHIDYMTSHYQGPLHMPHWDVSYKHAEGTYLQTKTGNPDILVDLLDYTKTADPTAQLFIDIDISSWSVMYKYVNFARDLLNKTDKVDRISIIADFSDLPGDETMETEIIKRRLDVVNMFGLPMWITQLDVPNDQNRATRLGQLLVLFFGYPSVEGIMLKDMTTLTQAYNGRTPFINNDLGNTWDTYVRTMFRTSEVMVPSIGGEEVNSIKAYYGSYEMTVKHLDQVASTSTFELERGRESDLVVAFECPGTF